MTDRAAANRAVAKEIGYSSSPLATQREVGIDRLDALRGDRWYETVREMVEQDSTVGAILYAVEMLMRTVNWRVEAADDSEEAQDWGTFLEECMEDLDGTWADFIAEVLSFIPYGYALFEVVYKRRLGETADPVTRSAYDDGRVGWRKFAYRPQETSAGWAWAGGEVVGWKQREPGAFEVKTIPLEKCLKFTTTARYGGPEGLSLLRRAYVPWYHKKELQVSEAIGIERDLAGLLLLKVPSTVLQGGTPDTRAAKQAYEKVIRNTRRGAQEGIMVPSDLWPESSEPQYEASLLSSGGSRQFDTDKIISRYRTDIAMVLLADFILLGHSTTGTYTAGVSKARVFTQALTAWLDSIRDELNERGVKPLMRLNGAPEELWPKLAHDDPDSADLQTLGSYVKALKDVGAFHDTPEVSRLLMEMAGLPGPAKEDGDDEPEEEPEIPALPPGDPQDPGDLDVPSPDPALANPGPAVPPTAALPAGTGGGS